jgi:hypothetical protein
MAIRLAAPVLVVCALIAASAAPAAERHRADSFEGTCQFSGILRQQPPVTSLPHPGTATARAIGTCSGTLTRANGQKRDLDASPSRYLARAQGDISCGGGTAEGHGYIRVGGAKVRFLFSEVRGPGAAAVRLEGRGGGSTAGEARVSADEDPVEIAQKCSGQGLDVVRIDIDIATTPALSG